MICHLGPHPPFEMPSVTTLRELTHSEPRAANCLTQLLAAPVERREGQPMRRPQALLIVCPHEARAEAVAQSVVMALLCTERSGRDGCGTCRGCRRAQAGEHANLLAPEGGARGLSVAQVRTLTEKLSFTAQEGRLKVVRIAAMSRMGAAAQNALLKTLEEPRGDTVFVLSGSRVHTVLPTVRSRVQLVRLHGSGETVAAATLLAAGVHEPMCHLYALALGDDVAAAQAAQKEGVHAWVERLGDVLQGGDEAAAMAKLAQEAATQKAAGDWLLLALEALLCDAIAASFGAPAQSARAAFLLARLGERGAASLAAAADALLALRALGQTPINLSLALEGVFHLLLQRSV